MTIETTVNRQRFTDGERKALHELGYVVYFLSGRSINNFRQQGRSFGNRDFLSNFEELVSRRSEIAFSPLYNFSIPSNLRVNPSLFLPDSEFKTYSEHLAMIKRFSENLTKGRNRIPGITAILGQAPDYIELAFLHFDTTGKYLFGPAYDHTRTLTRCESYIVSVGSYCNPDGVVSVTGFLPDSCGDHIQVAPLIVPT
ncbi:MAG: hypothetical protein V1808_00420 [Candidatus Daviesbacteria bacterium]